MKKLILSPYSKELKNGAKNPKNYPWFESVVAMLQRKYGPGYWEVYQTRLNVAEPEIRGVTGCLDGLMLQKLKYEAEKCDVWLSVDNFFHHMMWDSSNGVVIWGQSDPRIFGSKKHIHLLKDIQYLRDNQFDIWDNTAYREDCWVEPSKIVHVIDNLTMCCG